MEMTFLLPALIPIVAYLLWPHKVTAPEALITTVVITALMCIVFFTGRYGEATDFEVLNGQITAKERNHDSYRRSYQCRCHTNSKGTRKCSTCYETRYTVTWLARSTVGNITFDHADSGSRSVYNRADPQVYTECTVGEPASQVHTYDNWVKGAPESLFQSKAAHTVAYPEVYQFYRYIRVLNRGTDVDGASLNRLLNNALKTLGPKKQVNVIVVLTPEPIDLENQWLGGKKNDVVINLVINKSAIIDAKVFSWARSHKNETLVVKLRDDLKSLATYDPARVAEAITTNLENYNRPQMVDFEYLKNEIDPPTWVVVLMLLLGVPGCLGLTYYFKENGR